MLSILLHSPMDLKRKWLLIGLATFILLGITAAIKIDQTESSTFKIVSDAADVVIKNFGWSKDDIKVSNIDMKDAKIGQTMIYEFDIQVGDVIYPLMLSEEITSWRFLDELLPGKEDTEEETSPAILDQVKPESLNAVLAPFKLSGPVELWIQDAKQLRLALPHDVEAGVLKKVLLADGAVVTVEGAREVSLERPLQLPLPLPHGVQEGGLAASLLELADRLRYASRMEQRPLLSLRIVGPTSLVASAPKDSGSTSSKLKVKRLAPGAVELISHKQQDQALVESLETLPALRKSQTWMWPLPSLNGSDSKLLNIEKILIASLGAKAYKKGSFKLLRAKVSTATFVLIEFELEKKLTNESFPPELWPEWKTRPSVQRLRFEILAKVEGQKLLPVKVRHVEPYISVETRPWRVEMGNISYNKIPQIFLPPSPMSLDPRWDGIMD